MVSGLVWGLSRRECDRSARGSHGQEGVPVSVLLTNEQPTQMVPKQVKSNACLKEIEGVGEGG